MNYIYGYKFNSNTIILNSNPQKTYQIWIPLCQIFPLGPITRHTHEAWHLGRRSPKQFVGVGVLGGSRAMHLVASERHFTLQCKYIAIPLRWKVINLSWESPSTLTSIFFSFLWSQSSMRIPPYLCVQWKLMAWTAFMYYSTEINVILISKYRATQFNNQTLHNV